MPELEKNHAYYLKISKSLGLAYDHFGNPADCYVKAELPFDKETPERIKKLMLIGVPTVLADYLSVPEESIEVISEEEYYKNVRSCRECGCTDMEACEFLGERCYWVEDDLCSNCSRISHLESGE